MQRFAVPLRPSRRRPCRVVVGAGALELLVAELVRDPPGQPLFIVSDRRVAPLHAAPLAQRLGRRGLAVELLTFPAGERSKTRRTKEALEDRLFRSGAGRDCALLAVGGGVTGDLAGFVAATWHRGVPVVQVPTTLLAMVDSALGGKTGVDLPGGKNLVGAFHQPEAIYADPAVLGTLDGRHYRDGFAEAVKTAVIADAGLFDRLERSVPRLLAREPAALEAVVAACLRHKAAIVAADERDDGRRAMLNFGHTVAHALEAVSRFGLRHGPAVAIGL
ncbi:MAG TPA: 3-dehydroquinate synthase family protein, partial [Candidatus Polarisedimenticolaceae bacterium]|nr:3-dehydroquinate synthase family protein [Candidatus Polarisedimenticolaceae bacterium]